MGTWIQRAPMPTPRHDLQSIAVDGTIYAISGADDLTVDAVEIYDVASDTWTQGPPIPTKRGWLGAARIGRRIYVAGGKTIRTPEEKKAYGHDYHFTSRDNLEMLNLDTQTWSALAPMPGGPRAGLAVTACQDQIWAIGGNTMLREDPGILDRVEVYDIATDTWTPGPALPRPTQGPTVATHNGRIYLTGGISDEDPERPCRSEDLCARSRGGSLGSAGTGAYRTRIVRLLRPRRSALHLRRQRSALLSGHRNLRHPSRPLVRRRAHAVGQGPGCRPVW